MLHQKCNSPWASACPKSVLRASCITWWPGMGYLEAKQIQLDSLVSREVMLKATGFHWSYTGTDQWPQQADWHAYSGSDVESDVSWQLLPVWVAAVRDMALRLTRIQRRSHTIHIAGRKLFSRGTRDLPKKVRMKISNVGTDNEGLIKANTRPS